VMKFSCTTESDQGTASDVTQLRLTNVRFDAFINFGKMSLSVTIKSSTKRWFISRILLRADGINLDPSSPTTFWPSSPYEKQIEGLQQNSRPLSCGACFLCSTPHQHMASCTETTIIGSFIAHPVGRTSLISCGCDLFIFLFRHEMLSSMFDNAKRR